MKSAAYIMTLINPLPTGIEGRWRMNAHRNLCLGTPEGKHLSGGNYPHRWQRGRDHNCLAWITPNCRRFRLGYRARSATT
jgi:hypothetical protein